MSEPGRMWLGYRPGGGRAWLDAAGCKVLILGSRARDIAALSALSAKESGFRPVVFDLGGSLARRLSGCFDAFDYHAFLYDAFRMEAPEHWHSQLAAAAYATSLDLSFDQEAVANAALQALASEGGMASPASVYDAIGGVDGFRAAYTDGLKGRVASLKLFDAVDDQPVARLLEGDAIVDFHSSPYPQAAELAACLLLAKLIASAHARGTPPPALLLVDGSRLFKWHARPMNSGRLLTELLEWGMVFFSSDQRQAIDARVLDACGVHICSSDAWHASSEGDGVLSGACVVQDMRSGQRTVFVPRRVVSKTSGYATSRPARSVPPRLTRMILDAVESYPLATRDSIVHYLAPEFLQADVDSELGSLISQECVVTELKDPGSGPRVFAYSLSEKGRQALSELNG